MIAVKALDSFLLRHGESDLFFYTTCVKPGELQEEDSRDMPVVMQEFVRSKRDVRVTVVGNTCFPAETAEEIDGDWRIHKDRTRFVKVDLPIRISDLCIALVRRLGLVYGAIDLARVGEEYWFFEINPTGEWGWVDDIFNGGITEALVEHLIAPANVRN
jgi:glutathione synthase/RimK-type ligase-like ATP-grasp enzyme